MLLGNFKRGRRKGSKNKKTRKDKGSKRVVGVNAPEARKWISTANSTSESIRGWLNTGKRLGLY